MITQILEINASRLQAFGNWIKSQFFIFSVIFLRVFFQMIFWCLLTVCLLNKNMVHYTFYLEIPIFNTIPTYHCSSHCCAYGTTVWSAYRTANWATHGTANWLIYISRNLEYFTQIIAIVILLTGQPTGQPTGRPTRPTGLFFICCILCYS